LVGNQPCGEFGGGKDPESSVHAVVAEAAELGAENGVGAGGGGGEVDVEALTRNGVLLEAELGDGEAVDDVLSVEPEIDFAVRGKDEFGGDKVVGGVGVVLVEAERIAFAGGYELGASDAEGGVGTGIAKVPGELDSVGFDLEGGEGGSGVACGGPEALGFDGEGGEDDGKGCEGKVFDAPEIFLCCVAAGEQTEQEDEVRKGEESEGDPEVE
jgi:hypothetical protein